MFGMSWTIGAVIGFEFVDKNFLGGGWVLHLGFLKIIYFADFDMDDE